MRTETVIQTVVALALVVGVSVVVAKQHQERHEAYESYQAMIGPHNPDDFRRPVCVSRDNDWGLILGSDNRMYLSDSGDPNSPMVPMTQHWSGYPQLTNLSCREQF